MLEKSLIKNHINEFTIQVEMDSVDTDNRLVGGWATLDNIDYSGHKVEIEASMKAFSNFRGNIREMHKENAVGTLQNFSKSVFVDKDGSIHNGIYVVVHISKGAPDVWEKVLDGTYNGFSIGLVNGKIENRYSEEDGREVGFISEYFLKELSIVDSPANKLSSFDYIKKSIDGSSNVVSDDYGFICHLDKTFVPNETPGNSCPNCGNELNKILIKGDKMADSKLNVDENAEDKSTEEVSAENSVDTEEASAEGNAVEVQDLSEDKTGTENQDPESQADPLEMMESRLKETMEGLVANLEARLNDSHKKELETASKSISEESEETFEKKISERVETLEKSVKESIAELQKSIEAKSTTEKEEINKAISEINETFGKFSDKFAIDKSVVEKNEPKVTDNTTPKWSGFFN